MYSSQLHAIGLTKTQSKILDHLYEHGLSKAKAIALAINQPRGAVYQSIDELIGLGLVEKLEEKNSVALFRAAHPSLIEKIVRQREEETHKNRQLFEEIMPGLLSNYNLTLNKPGVRFYEGAEGFTKNLDDTLTSQTEVYLFMSREGFAGEKKFDDINEEYKKKRLKQGIKKKILYVGAGPSAQPAGDYAEITQTKNLNRSDLKLNTNIHIYDNKVSYLVIKDEKLLAVLIEDPHIYAINKTWFELLWQTAR